MVKPKGLLENLLEEIGLQNSPNIFAWLLAGFLLLVDIYFWSDLFVSGSLANLCTAWHHSQNLFSIATFCQTIFDLFGFAEFLIQLSLMVLTNYLLLGNSVILSKSQEIAIARKYNIFIFKKSPYLTPLQCLRKSYSPGSIGFSLPTSFSRF